MGTKVVVRAEFFQEDDVYVGVAHELNVSSFGDTLGDARRSLQEAVEGFVEACQELGTLETVLEESGYALHQDVWLPHEPVAAELLTTISSSRSRESAGPS